ncbi:MAG: radical SAM protein [Candidatus Aenigmatarchaeota archaeon]
MKNNRDNPSNIDFLNVGNPCSMGCDHCFYVEPAPIDVSISENEDELIKGISDKFQNSSFFIYPKEITTSQYLLQTISRFNQKSVLSNGLNITDSFVGRLKNAGVEEVKITLYSNPEEQTYFNNNTEAEYRRIKDSIRRVKNGGLKATVNNVLDKKTARSIEPLCDSCYELGVQKISFLRFIPRTSRDMERSLVEDDMNIIIPSSENMKKQYENELYLSFNINFGPNFYGKSLEEARKKIEKSKQFWTKSPYLCPAINQDYYGISMKSGNIYWCFFLISDPDISKIGNITPDGDVNIDKNVVDLGENTLREKLSGNCTSENCQYQDLCLGGCRSSAYTFAKLKGMPDPLYAGMDICLTKSYERVFGKKEDLK